MDRTFLVKANCSLAFIPLLLLPSLADEQADYQKRQQEQVKAYQQQQKLGIKKEQQRFRKYLAESQAEFDTWHANEMSKFNDFKKSINRRWGKFVEPTNKKWVEYSDDEGSVSTVDFEKGEVTVEVLVGTDEPEEETGKRVQEAIQRVVSSKGAADLTPVQSEQVGKVLPQPVLHNQVQDKEGKPLVTANLSEFARDLLEDAKTVEVAPRDGTPRKAMVVTFKLAPDHLRKRMKPFLPYVRTYCGKYGIPQDHVLATIHTESCFNPMAVSQCNAIGLMQLVPKSGGREAYRFVYGTDLIPRVEYLYDPEKNIELGCAYIHVLMTRYFGGVSDKQSNEYCAIAGYNTGPGNVAYCFTRARKITPAVSVINGMDPRKVYRHMVAELPYAETRDYLQKVVKRMALYR